MAFWRGAVGRVRLCLFASLSFAIASEDALRPKYTRVGGEVETLWQRPSGEPKGIFFIAHGCQHQGTDVFNEVAEDGWKFDSCAASNYGSCLGLPEEAALRDYALSRGYVVMAVSGGSGLKSCWYDETDVRKVAAAVRHVRQAEHLRDAPLLALGASSGGAFVGLLPGFTDMDGLGNLQCIVPEIMAVDSSLNKDVPTLFIHMPRDKRTAAYVASNVEDLESRGVRVKELRVEPHPITPSFLKGCLAESDAQSFVKLLKERAVVDDGGFLKQDARARRWVAVAKEALPNSEDSFEPDESCLAELMNVAWAKHEFSAQYAKEVFDFCKEGHAAAPALAETGESADSSWTTRLGKMEVFEFGASSGPLAIALHGMNQALLHEFDPVAARLAKEGYHVLVPNFHSNEKTRPGQISPEELKGVLNDLLHASGQQELALLLGKSWGGGMASAAASAADLKVQKLVLVAPATTAPGSWPASLPVALFWAKDDSTVRPPTGHTQPGLLGRVQLFHTEPTGGHRVLPSYTEAIAKFARPAAVAGLGQLPTATEVDAQGIPKTAGLNADDTPRDLDVSESKGAKILALMAAFGGMAACLTFVQKQRRSKATRGGARPQKHGGALE